MYGSIYAVRDLPARDSKSIVFEEHPPINQMYSSRNMNNCLKECKKSTLGYQDDAGKGSENKDCDPIDCAAGICIFDGMVKLLACIGIIS